MALFNYASKEITLKVVYYGPGLCGKTTNLQKLHTTMSSDKKGKLLSLSTDADRTLFFDFMPVQLGKIKDFNIRFQLYTVPGQVRYNATRKLVLKGADAVVFVADSQKAMKEANVESLANMKENLVANNINPDEIPVVMQYNKRDLKTIMPVDELDMDLNPKGDSTVESSAYEGWGVDETFKLITKRLLQFISKKHNIQIAEPEPEEKAAAPAKPKSASKDKVSISIKDKSEEILEEPAEAATSAYGSDSMTDMLDAGGAAAELPTDEDWGGSQDDIDSAFDSVPPVQFDAPSAETAKEEDIFNAADMPSPNDSSLLEKMLKDEQGGAETSIESLATPVSESAPVDDADSSVSVDIMSELLHEVRETKRLQMEMYEGMKNMSAAIKSIMGRLGSKQTTKK